MIVLTAHLEFHQVHTKTQAGLACLATALNAGPHPWLPTCGASCLQCSTHSSLPRCLPCLQAQFYQDFPPKDAQSPAHSAFEADLADYLAQLHLPQPAADEAQALVRRHDFSAARAALVASVPGHHSGPNLTAYGHKKLGVLLSWEAWPARFAGTPIVAQSCCFGNVMKDGYLADELFYSLSGITSGSGGNVSGGPGMGQQLAVVWPTVKEVRQSLEGWYAGRHLGAGEWERGARREGG